MRRVTNIHTAKIYLHTKKIILCACHILGFYKSLIYNTENLNKYCISNIAAPYIIFTSTRRNEPYVFIMFSGFYRYDASIPSPACGDWAACISTTRFWSITYSFKLHRVACQIQNLKYCNQGLSNSIIIIFVKIYKLILLLTITDYFIWITDPFKGPVAWGEFFTIPSYLPSIENFE